MTLLSASGVRLAAAALLVGGASSLSPAPQDHRSIEGERLPAEAWGPMNFVDLLELTELEKGRPQDRTVRRMRGDAHGAWVVPSESGSSTTSSGTRYITNQWGDTSMGIGFPEPVDLTGAWILGQTGPEVWAESLVAIGYRDGVEVARTDAFESIGASPRWFAIELEAVDRVVFECSAAVGGAGWYGLDDLAFTSLRDGRAEVLDFEDLEHRFRLTGSGYRGLRWEQGTGTFDQDPRVIEQPLTDGTEDETQYRPEEETVMSSGGLGTAPGLIQDFKGAQLFDTGAGFIPPDTCGAIAPNHFVEVVNANLSVYDRVTQNRVVNVALSSLFGAGVGDPRVAWDHFDDRAVIIATDFNSRIYIAVSLTDDPTGTYFTTSFATDGGSDAGRWPDYPTLGLDENGFYTGIGQFGGSPVTMTIFAIDKAPLVDPSPSLGTVTAFRGFDFEGAIQPAVTYGTPGRQYLVSRKDSNELRLREIVPPLTSPTLNNLGTISIPSHNFPPDVESQGSSVPLDSVDHRPMNSVFRNGSLWTAHAVGVNNRAAARWYEIDPIAVATLQVGTVDDPVLGFVMPTLSVNANDDVVMGFSGSSSGQFAGAYYTGRLASDPSGEMARPVQYKVGEGPYQRLDGIGRNRWGDYSLTSVDPVDDETFWTVQEYAQTSNNWGTWMAELAYPPTIIDCNGNGVDDADDISNGTSQDCNSNGIPDECEPDCDGDGLPDACETDCNANGTPDDCESFSDCNSNGVPDECEPDCDGDGLPDDCETDCNANGTPDDCESFSDCNSNGIPDECEPDCDGDGLPDDCETDCNSNGTPDDCESFSDCNSNGIPDECEPDCDGDGLPDACETDCNANGTPDDCETFSDCNSNGIPDECEPDCDGDGLPDACETDCNANGTPDDCESFSDCNSNGIPDECEPDCDGDGLPDDCETDCNANGTPDDCETFDDCNSNGIPDECEPDCDGDGLPDACETDCNANGTPDDCETFDDCNSNGIPDECEPDCDGDGLPDACETDCNANGTPDDCETFDDCNSNGVPDECEPDSDGDGTIDACELGLNYCGPAVPNSSGLSGVMDASGSKVVGDNDLTLLGKQLAVNQFGYFLVSDTQGFVANPGGSQGNLCLGGTIGRYVKDVASTGATGSLSLLIDLDKLPAPLNIGVNPGETWNFQAWFRDNNPDQTSNFTDGLAITFL